ncbi:MAG: FtsX-like permease family protein [Clostridia bacterium]|nr:FtsX-like permease family protein [Clostridia bacterium]
MSIIVIVALGISFFIGIKSSSPAMGYSANEYFRENNLLDIRITSRIPFTQDDIEKIEEIKRVDYVVASKYVDALVSVGDTALIDVNGMELSCRISSLDIEKAKAFTQTGKADDSYVNRLVLKDGRYPEKSGECLVDATAVKTYDGIEIGSVIKLSAENSSISDSLKVQELTVVGAVDSPMYISTERGTTQVGSGSLSSFVYVSDDDFITDEINELFLKINYDDIYDKFSAEYEEIVDTIADEIKLISSDSMNSKLSDLKVEYSTKISDKQTEISDYEKSSDVQVAEKQKEIDDFKAYVDSEDEILTEKKEKSDAQKKQLKSTLDVQTKSLNDLKTQYEANVKAFDSQSSEIKGYNELKVIYDDLYEKHTAAKIKLDELEGQMQSDKADMEARNSALSEAKNRLNDRANKINTLNSEIQTLTGSVNQLKSELEDYNSRVIPTIKREISNLESEIKELENKEELTFAESALLKTKKENLKRKEDELASAQNKVTEIEKNISSAQGSISSKNSTLTTLRNDLKNDEVALAAAETAYTGAQSIYNNAKKSYEDAKSAYETDEATLQRHKASMDKLTSGQTKLLELSQTIEKQKSELDSLNIGVTQAQIRYSLSVRNASREIQKEQYDLDNAKSRYYTIDGELTKLKEDVEKKKSALAADLRNLQNTLNNIDSITWQTTTQPQLTGHLSFKKSMDNILSMSNIFPIIFFVTAMIACFVIMMKNVEEGRGSIGLLKSFGYSNFTITGKYILYSLLAWLGGAFVGCVLGTCVVPSAVYSIYDIVYTVPNVGARFDLKYILIGLGVSFATTMIATFFAVIRELRMYPAALMRPKMIGYSRRSLLEKLPDFWGRLPYGIVILIRTVIRSRKRVAVGSIAIACCTALILSSLGLYNSVTDVSSSQYGDEGIFDYDIQFVLNTEQNPEESSVLDSIRNDELVTAAMLISNVSMIVSSEEVGSCDSVHVVVPADTQNIASYINLEIIEGSADLSQKGIVLSQKLAQNLNVNAGDTIYLTDSDDAVHSVQVTGVVKNYVDHYAYVSPETYEEVFFKAPQYKYLVCTLKDYLSDSEISDFAAEYLKTEDVAGAATAQAMLRTADTAINQVTVLVILFVLSACLLAMIVMYTTSNVNISERTHEIANIKVIGFSDGEVLLYIIRENLVSTLIGTLIGLAGGVFLHKVLVNLISVDTVLYGSDIAWWSFFVAALIIWCVAALASLPILLKINKVRMAETLKSVE